jgi:hypothetical protein
MLKSRQQAKGVYTKMRAYCCIRKAFQRWYMQGRQACKADSAAQQCWAPHHHRGDACFCPSQTPQSRLPPLPSHKSAITWQRRMSAHVLHPCHTQM